MTGKQRHYKTMIYIYIYIKRQRKNTYKNCSSIREFVLNANRGKKTDTLDYANTLLKTEDYMKEIS
jgi:hypothetical protein